MKQSSMQMKESDVKLNTKKLNIPILDSIDYKIDNFFAQLLKTANDRDYQYAILNSIRIIDSYYMDKVEQSHQRSGEDSPIEFIRYAYSILLRTLMVNNNNFNDILFAPLSVDGFHSMKDLIHHCFTKGLSEKFRFEIKYGEYTIEKNEDKLLKLTPKFRYAYLEEFDKINTVLYSHIVKQTLDERYKKLMQRVPGVIIDMEKRVYIFNNYFIGYDTSEEIETLFSDLAFYDATQAVEWWCFSHDSLFGDVKYGIYVNTIVYFMGIALKHHQFCQVLLKTNPKNKKLMMHNLICAIKTESELVEFISERNNVSSDDARKILKTISIDCSNYKNHTEIYSAQAPFIKLSNHQYIMSINGCLDRPFEFLLSELKLQYKKEWDKNTSEREGIFKQDLYAYFRHDGKYKTFSENIIIVTKDEKKTDIDACVYDESTGDILFVQLKWQDLTYDSIRSLASKRKNYHEKAIMWINTVNKWIVDASEKDIADRLHVGPRFIDKKKIKLLVLGRFNGNYSTDSIQYDNVVFGQWYQLLRIVNEYKNGEQLLTRIYNDLKKESRIIFNKAKRKREFSFEDKKIVIV